MPSPALDPSQDPSAEAAGNRDRPADCGLGGVEWWEDPWLRITIDFYCRTIPYSQKEDVRQEILLQLLMAYQRFDRSRGIKWKTYAEQRLRGAIKDWRRSLDPLSRSERHRVTAGEAVPVAEVSIEAARSLAAPPENLERRILLREIEERLDHLELRWRRVLARRLQGMTLQEVGREIGMHVSRVEVVEKEAIARLGAMVR